MRSEKILWDIIEGNCRFRFGAGKRGTRSSTVLCKNPLNNEGVCKKSLCPLSNHRHAAVQEDADGLSLKVKRPEYADSPKNAWLSVPLPKNLSGEQLHQFIDTHCKYGLHNEVLIACMKRYAVLAAKDRRADLADDGVLRYRAIKRKDAKLEKARAKRHREKVKISKAVEHELLNRLHSGFYGALYAGITLQRQPPVDLEDLAAPPEELQREEAPAKAPAVAPLNRFGLSALMKKSKTPPETLKTIVSLES